MLCRLGGSSQQFVSSSRHTPSQTAGATSQPFLSGLQAARHSGAQQNMHQTPTQPSSTSHGALLQHPASIGGNSTRQSFTGFSGPASIAINADLDTNPKQTGSAAQSWTPMKASNDLPRQALVNKLMKGKELPINSLIAAGLDPTKSASTPRSSNPKSLQSKLVDVLVDTLLVLQMSLCSQLKVLDLFCGKSCGKSELLFVHVCSDTCCIKRASQVSCCIADPAGICGRQRAFCTEAQSRRTASH